MGLMRVLTWPGRARFTKVRARQIREKERCYQAWRSFVTIARAEHTATSGRCNGTSELHFLLTSAQRDLEFFARPAEPLGFATVVMSLLHDSTVSLTGEDLDHKLAGYDAEVRKAIDQFP